MVGAESTERIRVPLPGDERPGKAERSYLRFAQVGMEYGLTIVAMTVLGLWLDGRLHTSPLFTIVLLFAGFGVATWNLIRTVMAPDPRPGARPDAGPAKGSPKAGPDGSENPDLKA